MTARRPAANFDLTGLLRRLPDPGSSQDTELGGLLGLGVFFALVISGRDLDLLPTTIRMALVLAWPLVTYAFVVTGRIWIPVVYILVAAAGLRLVELQGYGGSDVLDAIWEGLGVLLAGGSPYSHTYLHTQPPGWPVPYPPAMFLTHLPGYLLAGKDGVFYNEAASSLVVLGAFVAMAARLSWTLGLPALAAYAALGNVVFGAADGSVETSTGAVLLLAVLAVAWAWDGGWDHRRVRIAGLTGAFALAMKASTVFVVLLLAIAVWQMAGRRSALRYAGAGLALLVALSIPFLLLGPVDYLRQLASVTGLHQDVYGWNIWVFAQGMGWPVASVEQARPVTILLTLAALVLVTRQRMTSIAMAALMGVLVTLVLFLTARWSSFIYYVLVEPILLAVPLLAAWHDRGPTADGAATVTPASWSDAA